MQSVPAARRYVADLSAEVFHDRWSGGVCPDLERLVRSGSFAGAGIGLGVRQLSRHRAVGSLPGFVVGDRDSVREWRHAGLSACERCFVRRW